MPARQEDGEVAEVHPEPVAGALQRGLLRGPQPGPRFGGVEARQLTQDGELRRSERDGVEPGPRDIRDALDVDPDRPEKRQSERDTAAGPAEADVQRA